MVIVVATAGVYWNSLNGPFVWDDESAIVANQTIQHLWPSRAPLMPPRETPVAGRPVVNYSFAVNHAIGGLNEWGYHVGNVALHISCALLLFGLVRRTLEQEPRILVALGAALLWAVHPLQSEAVNYVTQRTELMMTLLLFSTLYCVLRARRSGRAAIWQVLAVGACALGMASKETMAIAPLVVLLYDRTFEFSSWHDAFKARRNLYLALAATWIILALLLAEQSRSTAGFGVALSPWTYLLNQAQIVTEYLRLTIWPGPLVFDYGLPRPLSLSDVWPQAILMSAILIVSLVALIKWPRIGFLAATFLLALAPTSSIIPIVSEVGAERRMYLPLAGVAVLVAVGVQAVVARSGSNAVTKSRVRMMAAVSFAAVLATLATRTVFRNADYASPLTLWQTVVDRRPQGRARTSLAQELVRANRPDEAIAQLRAAVHDYPDARFGLGTELIVSGKTEEGLETLRTFISDKPGDLSRVPARILRGQTLVSQERLDEAAEEYRAILAAAPNHVQARLSLGDLLYAQGQYQGAAREHQTVLSAQPTSSTVQTRLGADLLAMGRISDAMDHFRAALQVEPDSPLITRMLAEAALRANDAVRAESYARDAVRLDPTNPLSHNVLGVALGSTGRMAEAAAEFQRALQLNPGYREARDNLERALKGGGPKAQGSGSREKP